MLNFWGPKIQKGDQFYQVSDFCKNCNHDSSYHTIAVSECLVDIWFAEICQLTLCIFESQSILSKSTGLCMDLQPAADPYNVVCSQSLVFIMYKQLCVLLHKYKGTTTLSDFCKVGPFNYSSASINRLFNTKNSFLQLPSRKATQKCEVS